MIEPQEKLLRALNWAGRGKYTASLVSSQEYSSNIAALKYEIVINYYQHPYSRYWSIGEGIDGNILINPDFGAIFYPLANLKKYKQYRQSDILTVFRFIRGLEELTFLIKTRL